MKFVLPEQVEYIISRLEKCGYRADIVGGSVRDLLLGKTPYDYDITTSATPDQTKAVFSDLRTIDTGIKHGTVSVILDGETYEITTYRVDGEYKDSRHPEEVFFTQRIEEDLARRDFTVNAIAYSPSHGITDPFGGRQDIADKVIRAVGDPYLRFDEDALRILRGVRFSATLGFEIEQSTSDAIRDKRHLLTNVSAERVYVELKKMLSGDYAYDVVYKYSDIITLIVPPLTKIVLPDRTRFEKADLYPRLLSLFALSHDDPSSAFDTACQSLRTERHIRKFGKEVLSCIGKYDMQSDISLTHALRELSVHWAITLVKLEVLLGADESAVERIVDINNNGACYGIDQLDINGNDIVSLGMTGRAVGEMLNQLLCAVIDRKCKNSRNALLAYAQRIINKTTEG
ncbi:MAG: CCA tRNA nucleotidyltransferase [Clostridia bacterium]|nr:CCA tRNA nucleotidyltransferase [Clostridia bacterium]